MFGLLAETVVKAVVIENIVKDVIEKVRED